MVGVEAEGAGPVHRQPDLEIGLDGQHIGIGVGRKQLVAELGRECVGAQLQVPLFQLRRYRSVGGKQGVGPREGLVPDADGKFAALFPQQFSLSEVRELDQLLQLMNGEDELYIRGMSLGDGKRFSLGEVVSLEVDDEGNLTIEDSAGQPADGSSPLEFREVVSGEEDGAD